MEKWTVESLKEYFDRIIEQRERAVRIAEENATQWRQNANEWRGAMTDRERLFLTREEFNEYRRGIEKLMAIEKERSDKQEGKGQGITQFIGWILAAITIIGFIITNLKK